MQRETITTRESIAAIQRDIQQLKRENLRWRKAAAIACVCFVGFSSLAASSLPRGISWSSFLNQEKAPISLKKQVVSQPVGEVLNVSEIRILNANGEQVGFIGSDEAGDGLILLGNPSGQPQAAMSVDTDGAGIFTAFNGGGAQAAILATDLAGDGFVGVGNSSGNLASTMGVGATGAGFIAVSNTQGMAGATLGVDTLDVGRLTIANESGTEVVQAYARGGNGQIDVTTSTGISIWASDDVPTTSSIPGTPSGLLGDLDNDGDVDFSDFLVFARNFGQTVGSG